MNDNTEMCEHCFYEVEELYICHTEDCMFHACYDCFEEHVRTCFREN